MKKLFFTLLLLLTSFSTYAKVDACIWGLKYGSSLEEVKREVKNRYKMDPNTIMSGSSILTYDNCDFWGHKAEIINLLFVDDKLYSAVVMLDQPAPEKLMSVYDKVKENGIKEYGSPTRSISYFSEPYKEGDGKVLDAIEEGKAIIYTAWNFPIKNPETSVNIAVLDSWQVAVFYKDLKLQKQADSKK